MSWAALGVADARVSKDAVGAGAFLAAITAVYVGVIAPASHLLEQDQAAVAVPLATASLALVAAWASPRRLWWVRQVIGAGVVVGLMSSQGETVALWFGASVVLAAWVALDRPPLPVSRRCAPGAALVVAALARLAVEVGQELGLRWQPLAALAVGFAVAAASVGRTWRPWLVLHRWLAFASDAVAGVAMAVLTYLWLAARRAFALDPLVSPTAADRGWSATDAPPVDPWRRSGRARRASGRDRVVRVLVVVALLAAIVVVRTAPWQENLTPSKLSMNVPYSGRPVPAYRDAPWYGALVRDMTWVLDERVALRPFRPRRVLDVRTDTVNVVDRKRVSWTAPSCDCRRVTVWMYGGSGAFGLGQRDEHTIASELAAITYDQGVTVDVENRGVPAAPHWREAALFAWDATREQPPDLVVFYDGAEEVASELILRQRGLGNIVGPFDPYQAEVYDSVVADLSMQSADDNGYVDWARLDRDERSPGQLAAERYERSRRMSEPIADQLGVVAHYFWQPDRYSGSPSEPATGEPGATFRGSADALSSDVHDLSRTLAGRGDTVFSDDTNHNEEGARLVALAMWDVLERDLRRFASTETGER